MQRIKKVQELLAREKLDGLIIDKPIDLYYLTGFQLTMGRLLISENNAQLYVDGRYLESCQGKSSLEVVLTSGYGLDSSFGQTWKYKKKKVGFDAEHTTYEQFLQMQGLDAQLVPLKSPIKRIREIKEEKEIDLLKKAAALDVKGYDFVVNSLQDGITEEALAIELEIFWRRLGGERLSFSPHIAFGANTSQPHYHVSHRTLGTGDPVLIDIGVVRNHYHSDMTRVVFWKEVDREIVKIYDIVKEAHRRAIASCRPGVLIGEVDRAARDWIASEGYEKYFPHALGHGVGLEIHEFPILRSHGEDAVRPLKEGMVITIEPGIYLPGQGGVRLEDTIVITEQGCDIITKSPFSVP